MDIKQLKYFVTIVEEGSISAAARKLYMSQPPLSYQMKLLEQELGCVLFERGIKNVSLTAKGKALYLRAKDILSLIKSTSDEVKGLENRQVIRIGIVSSLIDFAIQKYQNLENELGNVCFEISEKNTYELIDYLQKGLVSMVLVRKPFTCENCLSRKIMDDYLVAVGMDLPEKVDLNYLAKEKLIVYRRWNEIIEHQFTQNGFDYKPTYLNDDARTSLTLARRNFGVALVPHSATLNTDLKIAMIEDCTISSEVVLLYKKDNIYSEAESKLINSILSQIK